MATAAGSASDTTPASLSPEMLWRRVEEVYDSAQQTGAAFKTDTRTELFLDPQTPGIEFVLRIATALKAKPKGPPKQQEQQKGAQPQEKPKQWVNPFLPYEEDLWVAHLSQTHTLLLNKFNVVAKVLRAMPQGGVAFYNCGEHSGRSQPHKHLQVVPLPFDDAQPPRPPLQVAVDAACGGAAPLEATELRCLPFRAHAARLPEEVTANQLAQLSSRLLAACQSGLPAPVSYNVLLWREAMAMVPRSRESAGPCAINSLGFAGTMLLRSQEDMEYAKSTGPLAMLAAVGVPW